MWVKRPKKGMFGRKWIRQCKVVSRLGVRYRVRSKDGKTMVVHHDNLKLGYIPLDGWRVVPPGRESSDFTAVHSVTLHPVIHHLPKGLEGNFMNFGRIYVPKLPN